MIKAADSLTEITGAIFPFAWSENESFEGSLSSRAEMLTDILCRPRGAEIDTHDYHTSQYKTSSSNLSAWQLCCLLSFLMYVDHCCSTWFSHFEQSENTMPEMKGGTFGMYPIELLLIVKT
jgi:hypothetical protein